MSYTTNYLEFLTEQKKTTPLPNMPARPDWISPVAVKQGDRGSYEQLKKAIDVSKTENGVTYTPDGLVECNYDQLARALDVLDRLPTKRKMGYSAIIYGEAGIGKSALVEARARRMAADLGREFITKDEFINRFQTIQEVKGNLKDYYIFMDERVASFDPSMMSGIPDPTSPEKRGYLTEMPLPWVSLMTMSDEAAGFLFLDELNMADEEVQKALYSLLNFEERRIAGQYLIKGNWRIHSAGNWGEGYNSNPLRLALKERMAPFLLKVDFEGWSAWARSAKIENGQPIIHPILMDFIEEDPSANFYARPSEEHEATKRPNPRNLVALSAAIYTILGYSDNYAKVTSDMWEELIMTAGSICGQQFGDDFKQFLISNSIIDVTEILNEPGTLVKTKGSNEDEIIQRLGVFKRNFKNFVLTFDDKYSSLSSDEEKANMINTALNYVYVIDAVFGVEPSTAAIIFTPVVSKAVLPDFKLFMGTLSSFLKSQGNAEGVKYLNTLFKKLMEEVGGNVGALMGNTPTSFISSEDEESDVELDIDPQAAAKINSILSNFESKLSSNDLIDFV